MCYTVHYSSSCIITVLRLLLNMYTRQVTRVSWNGVFSRPFTVSNGVKQGGVLSPILFCIYIDSLLKSLAVSGVDCFIGRLFVGALVYADDIVLLSPTANGIRLHLCDEFDSDFAVIFNAAKSKCLWFKPRRSYAVYYRNPPCFMTGGNVIEFINS